MIIKINWFLPLHVLLEEPLFLEPHKLSRFSNRFLSLFHHTFLHEPFVPSLDAPGSSVLFVESDFFVKYYVFAEFKLIVDVAVHQCTLVWRLMSFLVFHDTSSLRDTTPILIIRSSSIVIWSAPHLYIRTGRLLSLPGLMTLILIGTGRWLGRARSTRHIRSLGA